MGIGPVSREAIFESMRFNPNRPAYRESAKVRAASSSTGQAVQTKFATPRAKNASAKLGASLSLRSCERSGVIPDSQAFENTNLGIRSMRLSSSAVNNSLVAALKIHPDLLGSPSHSKTQ